MSRSYEQQSLAVNDIFPPLLDTDDNDSCYADDVGDQSCDEHELQFGLLED